MYVKAALATGVSVDEIREVCCMPLSTVARPPDAKRFWPSTKHLWPKVC
jgi:hypothetical protein